MATELETKEGRIVGPWRKPVNISGEGTNIHDDADAQELGFRGGLVAGSIHMEMWIPLLLEAFGERWHETGNLSLYFLNATLHEEKVRALVEAPEKDAKEAQVETFGERPDGTPIAKGTAAAGQPEADSALYSRDLSKHSDGEYRILQNADVGDEFEAEECSIAPKAHEQRLEVITEMIPGYTDPAKWGGLVASPVPFVNLLATPARTYLEERLTSPAVGLFGAIEIRNVNGPLLVDRPYTISGVVRALGQSPKTEYYWYDAFADDEKGKRVAEMRMMTRFMKNSSALYNEGTTTAT